MIPSRSTMRIVMVYLTALTSLNRAVPVPGLGSQSSDPAPDATVEELSIDVSPTVVELSEDGTVTITCTVRARVTPKQVPILQFYRQLTNVTVKTQSSGDPGVVIRPVASGVSDSDSDLVVQSKSITLDSMAWLFLFEGNNQFFCKAKFPTLSPEDGPTVEAHFIVKKAETPRPSPHRRRHNRRRQQSRRKTEELWTIS